MSWEKDKPLAESPWGYTVRAIDAKRDHVAVMSILKKDAPAKLRERFDEMFNTARRVRHAALVRVLDAGQNDDGELFGCVEEAKGLSLQHRMDVGPPLTLKEAVELMVEVLGALSALHRADLAHGDVTPHHVFLEPDGDGVKPKLVSYGLNRALVRAGELPLDAPRHLDSLAYMSPEQAAKASVADPASDVYSAAAMVYSLFVGELPAVGASADAVRAAILERAPKKIGEARDELDGAIGDALDAALARDPKARPDADSFANKLRMGLIKMRGAADLESIVGPRDVAAGAEPPPPEPTPEPAEVAGASAETTGSDAANVVADSAAVDGGDTANVVAPAADDTAEREAAAKEAADREAAAKDAAEREASANEAAEREAATKEAAEREAAAKDAAAREASEREAAAKDAADKDAADKDAADKDASDKAAADKEAQAKEPRAKETRDDAPREPLKKKQGIPKRGKEAVSAADSARHEDSTQKIVPDEKKESAERKKEPPAKPNAPEGAGSPAPRPPEAGASGKLATSKLRRSPDKISQPGLPQRGLPVPSKISGKPSTLLPSTKATLPDRGPSPSERSEPSVPRLLVPTSERPPSFAASKKPASPMSKALVPRPPPAPADDDIDVSFADEPTELVPTNLAEMIARASASSEVDVEVPFEDDYEAPPTLVSGSGAPGPITVPSLAQPLSVPPEELVDFDEINSSPPPRLAALTPATHEVDDADDDHVRVLRVDGGPTEQPDRVPSLVPFDIPFDDEPAETGKRKKPLVPEDFDSVPAPPPAAPREVEREGVAKGPPIDLDALENLEPPPSRGWIGALVLALVIGGALFAYYFFVIRQTPDSTARLPVEPSVPAPPEPEPTPPVEEVVDAGPEQVELPEDPDHVRVTLEGLPEDAIVVIDGVLREPPYVIDRDARRHRVAVRRLGFNPWREQFVADRDQTLRVRLEPRVNAPRPPEPDELEDPLPP